MKLPLISIQIPTYNQKAFIKDALDSALAQTYENLQIIVSDDCSPDYDIFEYLSEYKNNPKVLIHRNDKNVGRVANYKDTLYQLVKGEWFVNLDGDDYFINPNFIQTAVDAINFSNADTIAFQAHSLTEKINRMDISYKLLGKDLFLIDGKEYIQHLDNELGFTHASLLYNVAAARKVNFYNINTLDIDYFSYLKILREGSVIFWNEKVYMWREHSEQETQSLNFDRSLAKYEEYDDLVLHYRDVSRVVKSVMLKKTYFDLTILLLRYFFNEKMTFRRFVIIFQKMKCNPKYILPFLSLLKRKIKS